MITNRERLLRLKHLAREVLPFVEPKLFDMGRWGQLTDCGTVCCAAGSDALTRFAQLRGLKLKQDRYSTNSFDISYAGYYSLSAVGQYYGILDDEVDYCFLPRGYMKEYWFMTGHADYAMPVDLKEVLTNDSITAARVAAHVENIIAFYEGSAA